MADGWQREREVEPVARGGRHRWSRWREVGGLWVAAGEYGVIGEISRGSSTAANARKRRLSSRCPPFSISFSFSPSPPSPSLLLSRLVRCHSTLVDAASLFLPNSYSLFFSLSLSTSLLPFLLLSLLSVLYMNICKRKIASLACAALDQHRRTNAL